MIWQVLELLTLLERSRHTSLKHRRDGEIMAKRSYIQAIKTKQSSAYSGQRSTAPSIHQIDGSSKREVSRSTIEALKSWTIGSGGVSEAALDKAAEAKMDGGWSRSIHKICPQCFIQKALNGACGCSN
jgi:hypothetical protein